MQPLTKTRGCLPSSAAREGSNDWHDVSGAVVGTGWQRFFRVVGSTNAVIYAIESNGDLKWYRHTGVRDGENRWHGNFGARIGTGWRRFRAVAACGKTIYAVEPKGELMWYRHNGFFKGERVWEGSRAKKVGTGWQIFSDLICTRQGKLYGVVA